MDEQVYNRYYDTGGNYHWIGVHSGEHIVRKGEKMDESEEEDEQIHYHDMSDGQGMWYVWRDEIHDMPTADVVEVVRCKDCTRQMICFHSDDYFCADGERREDAEAVNTKN